MPVNLVIACRPCNGCRGRTPVADWFDFCQSCGDRPDVSRLITLLQRVADQSSVDAPGVAEHARIAVFQLIDGLAT